MSNAQKKALTKMYFTIIKDSIVKVCEYDRDLMIFLKQLAQQYQFAKCATDLEKLRAFKPVEFNAPTCNCGAEIKTSFFGKYHSRWVQCCNCHLIFKIK